METKCCEKCTQETHYASGAWAGNVCKHPDCFCHQPKEQIEEIELAVKILDVLANGFKEMTKAIREAAPHLNRKDV